jgi:hypothetical protein
MATKQERTSRIAAGKCVQCGVNEPEANVLVCERCKIRLRQYHKNRQTKKKANGICVKCDNMVVCGHTRCEQHLNELSKLNLIRYEENKSNGICVKCGTNTPEQGKVRCTICLKIEKTYRETHKDNIKIYNKTSRANLRLEVLNNYGGAICACCGENIIEFLDIDHIDGGGTKHKKIIGYNALYRWLRDNNYPDGYQVLCRNCNWGKYINGGVCPHKRGDTKCQIQNLTTSSSPEK